MSEYLLVFVKLYTLDFQSMCVLFTFCFLCVYHQDYILNHIEHLCLAHLKVLAWIFPIHTYHIQCQNSLNNALKINSKNTEIRTLAGSGTRRCAHVRGRNSRSGYM